MAGPGVGGAEGIGAIGAAGVEDPAAALGEVGKRRVGRALTCIVDDVGVPGVEVNVEGTTGAAFRGRSCKGATRHAVEGTAGGAFLGGRRSSASSSTSVGTGGGAFLGVGGTEHIPRSGIAFVATPAVDAGVWAPDGTVDPPPTPPPTIGAKLSLRSANQVRRQQAHHGTMPVRRTAAIAATSCKATAVLSWEAMTRRRHRRMLSEKAEDVERVEQEMLRQLRR